MEEKKTLWNKPFLIFIYFLRFHIDVFSNWLEHLRPNSAIFQNMSLILLSSLTDVDKKKEWQKIKNSDFPFFIFLLLCKSSTEHVQVLRRKEMIFISIFDESSFLFLINIFVSYQKYKILNLGCSRRGLWLPSHKFSVLHMW